MSSGSNNRQMINLSQFHGLAPFSESSMCIYCKRELCQRKYLFGLIFPSKHHCRRCGATVCEDCSVVPIVELPETRRCDLRKSKYCDDRLIVYLADSKILEKKLNIGGE